MMVCGLYRLVCQRGLNPPAMPPAWCVVGLTTVTVDLVYYLFLINFVSKVYELENVGNSINYYNCLILTNEPAISIITN